MANTASTSTAISNASNATFQAWVNEIYTQLVTTCGLSHTLDTGQMAIPCVSARPAINTSAGFYNFRFTDPLCLGPIATTNGLVGGTLYNGSVTHTFTAVPLTGGTGTGAQATVNCTSGVVTAVTITSAGTGYNACDQLSANNTDLGGSGSGFHVQVATLTSGTPVVMRVEFGSDGSTSWPQMWITVGFGTSGAGVITGSDGVTRTTRVACFSGTAPISLTTPYVSRFCYNPTLGFLGLVHKIGSTANTANGAFFLFRTNDNAGASTNNGIVLMTSSFATTGMQGGATGFMQVLSQSQAVVYPLGPAYPTLQQSACQSWGAGLGSYNADQNTLFNLANTIANGVVFVFPIYTIDPTIRYSAFMGEVLPADIPLNTSISAAIVGATALTLLNVGTPFGATTIGQPNNGNINLVMLWQ